MDGVGPASRGSWFIDPLERPMALRLRRDRLRSSASDHGR